MELNNGSLFIYTASCTTVKISNLIGLNDLRSLVIVGTKI